MHIVLSVLGAIVGILILLKRLDDNGIDVGWLKSLVWRRNRNWKKRYEGDPIYAMENPMEVAALLMLGVARRDGDLTNNEKTALLKIFREEFHLTEREAASLLASSAHLLRDGDAFIYNLDKVLKPTDGKFTKEQAESTLPLMEDIAAMDGPPTALQQELIDDVRQVLVKDLEPEGKWR